MSKNAFARPPRAFGAIVYGGLTVGVLDLLEATIFFGIRNGVKPIRILHSIAAGLVGRERAINGGLKTMLLGIFLHFVIAFIIATVFYIGCLVLPGLIRHPVIWGLLYGVLLGDIAIMLANAATSVLAGSVLYFKLRYG